MFRCNIAFGDRDEARQTRLGSKQIVTARIECPLDGLITDREQLPSRIQKESELHLVEEFSGKLVETFNSPHESLGSCRRLLQCGNEAVNFGDTIASVGSLWRQLFDQYLTVIR